MSQSSVINYILYAKLMCGTRQTWQDKYTVESIKLCKEALKQVLDEPDDIKISLLSEHSYFLILLRDDFRNESFQIKAVQQDYTLINYIVNPSYEVMRAAVLSDPIAIHLIDNPPQDLIDLVGTIKTFE